MKTKLLVLLLNFSISLLVAQNFSSTAESSLPTTNLSDYWTGASWVDVDQDNDLDLFLTNRIPGPTQRRNFLYINQSGEFDYAPSSELLTSYGYWFGNTWGDYNNDGLIDVFVAGFPAALFKNLGNAQFERVGLGVSNPGNVAGIGAAFGDLNADGLLDIVLVRPNWIQAPPGTGLPGAPHILINNGAPHYTFSILNVPAMTDIGADTYLQPTLSDFDDDGDLDLFIAMGSGQPKKDLIFKNLLTETGSLTFEHLSNTTLSESLLEGNHWSFEDIDNDGDRDAFVTNWAVMINNETAPRANTLFKNENPGFLETNTPPLTTDEGLTTTACWGDYDNDADLDVITISDSTFLLKYYQNDGAGNFTNIEAGELGTIDKHQSGGTTGDYDQDGDLDIFIPGPDDHFSFLRNDLDNAYNWIQFLLEGTASNSSAIGSKIWLHCKIDGIEVVQHREVSSCNAFFGMNSLVQHFGLKTATSIDSLSIIWPTGEREVFYELAVNQFHIIEEGQGGTINTEKTAAYPKPEINIYPNPASSQLNIIVRNLPRGNNLNVYLNTLDGKTIKHLGTIKDQENHSIKVDSFFLDQLPRGAYIINIHGMKEGVSYSKKVVLE